MRVKKDSVKTTSEGALNQKPHTSGDDPAECLPSISQHTIAIRKQAHDITTRKPRPLREQAEFGFTLIELLVVIAIIAIIAAFLFPVFSQAKKASKSAVAMTQAKQIGIAHHLYIEDYDGVMMMGGQWYSTDPDAVQNGTQATYLPWPALAEPYIKSISLFISPLVSATSPFVYSSLNQCTSARSCAIRYPHFGYNMMYLAPWADDPAVGSYVPQPYSYSHIARDTQQVLLTEIWTRSTCPATTAWGSGRGQGYVTYGEAPPPDKKHRYAYGSRMPDWGHGWGKDASAALAWATIPTFEEGKYTGGVAFRVANKTSVVFADGHVKKMNADELAQGTNWSTSNKEIQSSQIRNLRDGKYLWHPEGN